jgi:hypothetical protein
MRNRDIYENENIFKKNGFSGLDLGGVVINCYRGRSKRVEKPEGLEINKNHASAKKVNPLSMIYNELIYIFVYKRSLKGRLIGIFGCITVAFKYFRQGDKRVCA